MINYSEALQLPFEDYIKWWKEKIRIYRVPLHNGKTAADLIIDSNAPFALEPNDKQKNSKIGVLLIHGLLDSPFSLRDIGLSLRDVGIRSHAVLLPGHATLPLHLREVQYEDWCKTIAYGVASLKPYVERIVLIGYSTGAALAIHHALHDKSIAGLGLFAPCIKMRVPMRLFRFYSLAQRLWQGNDPYVFWHKEINYVKYLSFTQHPVLEVERLTEVIQQKIQLTNFLTPLWMCLSQSDETISAEHAIAFFKQTKNQNNQLRLYTDQTFNSNDARLQICSSKYPALRIRNFSHICLPFSKNNFHYGDQGDYAHASRNEQKQFVFGAYDYPQAKFYDLLYHLQVCQHRHAELTYNPDFSEMMTSLIAFLQKIK